MILTAIFCPWISATSFLISSVPFSNDLTSLSAVLFSTSASSRLAAFWASEDLEGPSLIEDELELLEDLTVFFSCGGLPASEGVRVLLRFILDTEYWQSNRQQFKKNQEISLINTRSLKPIRPPFFHLQTRIISLSSPLTSTACLEVPNWPYLVKLEVLMLIMGWREKHDIIYFHFWFLLTSTPTVEIWTRYGAIE